jgi:hypothetical protein
MDHDALFKMLLKTPAMLQALTTIDDLRLTIDRWPSWLSRGVRIEMAIFSGYHDVQSDFPAGAVEEGMER